MSEDRQAFYSPDYVPMGQSQSTLPGPTVDPEAYSSSSFNPEAQTSSSFLPSRYVDLDAPAEAEPWREEIGRHEEAYQGISI